MDNLKRRFEERMAHTTGVHQQEVLTPLTCTEMTPMPLVASSGGIGGTVSNVVGNVHSANDYFNALDIGPAMNSPMPELYSTENGVPASGRAEGGRRRYSSRRANGDRRNRINERERDRMHQLCDAFEKLRKVLPYHKGKRGPNRQKLSKIATLLLAQNYIRALEEMLQGGPSSSSSYEVSTTSSSTAQPSSNSCHVPVPESPSTTNTLAEITASGFYETSYTTVAPVQHCTSTAIHPYYYASASAFDVPSTYPPQSYPPPASL